MNANDSYNYELYNKPIKEGSENIVVAINNEKGSTKCSKNY